MLVCCDQRIKHCNNTRRTISPINKAIKKISIDEIKGSENLDEENLKINLQEIQMIKEQLIWLTNLSTNIVTTTKSLMES